jgi:hypothetical protein
VFSEITSMELSSIARNGEERTASMIFARKRHINDNLKRFERGDENHF